MCHCRQHFLKTMSPGEDRLLKSKPTAGYPTKQ
jgi:hypothetical protein